MGAKKLYAEFYEDSGFGGKKTKDNTAILTERQDIRYQTLCFIRKIKKYREEMRPIIYVDDTYIHSSHTTPHSWYDSTGAGTRAPVSKENRLIIVHAGGEAGFVPDALLIYKSSAQTGDYHGEMNSDIFIKWLREKLTPNSQPRSVLVLDNASYHSVQIWPAPTSNSTK